MSPEKSTLDSLRIDRSAPEKKNLSPRILVVIGAIILLAIASAWWFNRPKVAPVRTFVVQQAAGGGGQKTLLNGSGYVTPRREATVSSKVTGKVLEVFIEEGMKVTAGQVLATLDSSNTKANLNLAEAQLHASKSTLGETNVRLAEAEREFRRVSDLAKGKIATGADLDRAQAEVDSLRARLDRQQVEVSVAERQVALWHQQMEDTVIRAPFAGVVVSKNAQPGEMISPMSAGGFTRTGICTIVDMDSLEIEIEVNEGYINRVEPNQPVEAMLDAYPEWKIPCKVIATIPTANRQNATVKVRVGFEKLDPRILPQMGVKVAFHGGKEVQGGNRYLTLPKTAVRRQDGRDVVFVLQQGRAERRAVTIGSSGGDDVGIAAGLTAGEKVIVEGPENLASGDRVEETTK